METPDVWNLFKTNDKDNITTFLSSFWCLYRQFWKNFTHGSGASINDFIQENAGWEVWNINNLFMHNVEKWSNIL